MTKFGFSIPNRYHLKENGIPHPVFALCASKMIIVEHDTWQEARTVFVEALGEEYCHRWAFQYTNGEIGGFQGLDWPVSFVDLEDVLILNSLNRATVQFREFLATKHPRDRSAYFVRMVDDYGVRGREPNNPSRTPAEKALTVIGKSTTFMTALFGDQENE